jgi:hypothetical protein
MALIQGPLFGVRFLGGVSPSKSDLASPIERECNSVQKHVLSYYVKISESSFVWAAPTVLRGGPYLINSFQAIVPLTG